MIRFRNGASNIDSIINHFKSLYTDFSSKESFTLDDIAVCFAINKHASSSGFIGEAALRRSYQIEDNSRKSMKMQSKSYAEIYRILGWINSEEDNALNFQFTFLGKHVALAEGNETDIFEQCLLGINYPNEVIDVKFRDSNKPFLNILRFASELDGHICRDEILLGPMDLKDGYSENMIERSLKKIQNIRKTEDYNILMENFQILCDREGMKPTSVQNLTRFPLSAIQYVGWFERKRLNTYKNKKMVFFVLTDYGKQVLKQVQNRVSIDGNKLIREKESVIASTLR